MSAADELLRTEAHLESQAGLAVALSSRREAVAWFSAYACVLARSGNAEKLGDLLASFRGAAIEESDGGGDDEGEDGAGTAALATAVVPMVWNRSAPDWSDGGDEDAEAAGAGGGGLSAWEPTMMEGLLDRGAVLDRALQVVGADRRFQRIVTEYRALEADARARRAQTSGEGSAAAAAAPVIAS